MIGVRHLARAGLVLAGVALAGCRTTAPAAAPPAPPLTSRMLTADDVPADLGQVMVQPLPNPSASPTTTAAAADRCPVELPINYLAARPTDSTLVFFAGPSVSGAEIAAVFPGDDAARNFTSLRDSATDCDPHTTYTVTAVPGLGNEAIRIKSRSDLTDVLPGTAIRDRDTVVVRVGAYLIEVYVMDFELTDLPHSPADAVLELARAAVTRFG